MMAESDVQSRIRLAAAEDGVMLWRNNSGALKDRYGTLVRFGLGNDSPKVQQNFRSGDLIGMRPTLVTQAMVGQVVGILTSVEAKREGWRMSWDEHETAQANWAQLVIRYGGRAGFAQSVEDARLIWR